MQPIRRRTLYALLLLAGLGWIVVSGMVFLLWLALMSASRLFIESFRGDSTLVFGGLRLAQLPACLILLAALAGMETLRIKPQESVARSGNPDQQESTAPHGNRAE